MYFALPHPTTELDTLTLYHPLDFSKISTVFPLYNFATLSQSELGPLLIFKALAVTVPFSRALAFMELTDTATAPIPKAAIAFFTTITPPNKFL